MKRFAVIGDPVEHSMSPAMHNAVFKKLKLDCSFGKVRVPKGKLDEKALEKLKEEYIGLSVTIPHKLAVVPLLDKLDRSAEMIGAVNCVDFKGGKAKGYNTDMAGAIEPLKAKLGKLKGKKILILGAGGAARAIAFGCALEGCEIAIWNRTESKAVELMEEIMKIPGAEGWDSDESATKPLDAIINATSVGMHPKTEAIPIHEDFLGPDITVMDIVYNPLETKLLRIARKHGCPTIDGLEMLVGQGAEALKIWLGVDAPRDVMRKAALKELKG